MLKTDRGSFRIRPFRIRQCDELAVIAQRQNDLVQPRHPDYEIGVIEQFAIAPLERRSTRIYIPRQALAPQTVFTMGRIRFMRLNTAAEATPSTRFFSSESFLPCRGTRI